MAAELLYLVLASLITALVHVVATAAAAYQSGGARQGMTGKTLPSEL